MTTTAFLLTFSLLPAAALKAQPIPAPAPASSTEAPVPPPLSERLPPEQRAGYELIAQKCSRCHSPERALEAHFTADQWDDYLRRKLKRVGAGFTEEQMREIGAFLRYWATAQR